MQSQVDAADHQNQMTLLIDRAELTDGSLDQVREADRALRRPDVAWLGEPQTPVSPVDFPSDRIANLKLGRSSPMRDRAKSDV